MKEFTVSGQDNGRRLDKYLLGILKNSPSSFVYKMLRKKNIVLNDKKASGSELLHDGDRIKLYLSDETFAKFSQSPEDDADHSALMPHVIYEDEDILIVDKPSGMLTQKSSATDISLNEICLSYVRNNRSGSPDDTDTFTPSVCNRLDRNTSGLVTFAKTYRGARALGDLFRGHDAGKYYRCIAAGIVEDADLEGTLVKDGSSNTVKVSEDNGRGSYIRTAIRKISDNGSLSLCEIRLFTGKTHQIRAHLASIGHPIIGDPKYGDKAVNEKYRKKYGVNSQLLVCNRLVIPDDFCLPSVAGRTIETEVPDIFDKVM